MDGRGAFTIVLKPETNRPPHTELHAYTVPHT